MSASLIKEFTGEADDDAVCSAAGVKERDHSTIPPTTRHVSTSKVSVVRAHSDLYVILSSDQALF